MPDYFLDDATFQAFQEYIYRLTGIHYTRAKRYLLDTRVAKRARQAGLQDGAEYLDFLENNPDGKREIEQLIDQLSIHETSFFRHPKQIDIARQLLSELIAVRRRQGPRRLRLWSAACSSGEEPYTLAMLVRELLGGELEQWEVAITGTDISKAVVGRARAGSFGRRSVQTVPEPYLSRYFRPDPQDPQQFTLTADIAGMATFRTLSLLDDFRVKEVRDQDLILCRNVLIYFDTKAKKKVLEALWNALQPGGYLVLGPSESLYGLTDAFQRTPHSVFNIYQRPAEKPAPAARPLPEPVRRPAVLSDETPILQSAVSLRVRSLITRLDLGLNELKRDFDSSLSKTIEGIGEIADTVQELSADQTVDRRVQAKLNRIDRQLTHILLFLQVGDRGQQKMEALRGVLQELSDRLLGRQQEAPDLQVRTETFDTSILPEDADQDGKPDDEILSQEDIDALFN